MGLNLLTNEDGDEPLNPKRWEAWEDEHVSRMLLSMLYEVIKEWNFTIEFFWLDTVPENFNASLDMQRLWGGDTNTTRAQFMDTLIQYFAPGGQMDEILEHVRIKKIDAPSGDEIRAAVYAGKPYDLNKLRDETDILD